jgi:hypothetical protein
MLTVIQLAARLGCSVRRAQELCAAGLPGVVQLGRAYIVADEDAAVAAGSTRCTRRGRKARQP